MPEQKSLPVIREGAHVAQVYNDGLCAYLYDETRSAALAGLLAQANAAEGSEASLYERLTQKKFASAALKGGLVMAYTLRQDDPLQVEVAVGAPLTKAELKKSHWLKPQTGYLNLPGGRLRLDSPNSLPLEPDFVPGEGADAGAVLEVPPGHYKVTLYRTDWDALERDEENPIEPPGEVLVLSPIEAPAKPPAKDVVLPYVPPLDDNAWRTAFAVEGQKFTAQGKAGYWWEPWRLNLSREAVQQLGLEPGSMLQVNISGFTLHALYIGEMEYLAAAKMSNEPFISALKEQYPDFCMAIWQEWKYDLRSEGDILLTLHRLNGKDPIPKKFHELWAEASGQVLETKHPLP